MKNSFVFLLVSILLTSCYSKLPDYGEMKKSNFTDSNPGIDSIRTDIQERYSSLSFEQKLEICIQKYSLEFPEIHQGMIENKPKNVKETLLLDSGFVRICNSMGIDPNNIPPDYFSPSR